MKIVGNGQEWVRVCFAPNGRIPFEAEIKARWNLIDSISTSALDLSADSETSVVGLDALTASLSEPKNTLADKVDGESGVFLDSLFVTGIGGKFNMGLVDEEVAANGMTFGSISVQTRSKKSLEFENLGDTKIQLQVFTAAGEAMQSGVPVKYPVSYTPIHSVLTFLFCQCISLTISTTMIQLMPNERGKFQLLCKGLKTSCKEPPTFSSVWNLLTSYCR